MKHREFTQSRTVQNSNTKTHSARDRTPSPSASQCAKMRASRASSCAASDRKPSIASPPLSSGRACRPRGTHSSTPRAIREFGLHSLRRRSLADDTMDDTMPCLMRVRSLVQPHGHKSILGSVSSLRILSVGRPAAALSAAPWLLRPSAQCCWPATVLRLAARRSRGRIEDRYRSPSGRYAWGRPTQSPAGVQVVAATGCVAGVVWPPVSGVSRCQE